MVITGTKHINMQENSNTISNVLTQLESQYVEMNFPLIEPQVEKLYGLITAIIIMAVVAVLRLNNVTLFKNLIVGIFNYKKANALIGTGYATLGQRLLLLSISFLMLSILITFLVTGKMIEPITPLLFIALYTAHYLTILLYKYLAWTFNQNRVATVASLNLWLSNISFGVITAPFIISLFFVRSDYRETILLIITILASILFAARIFRWIRILFDNRVFIFYMILYLCALEIAPLILLVKLLEL